MSKTTKPVTIKAKGTFTPPPTPKPPEVKKEEEEKQDG